MFPLAGKTFPSSTDVLASAIERALAEVFTLGKKNVVQIEGDFPSLRSVRINLNGAAVNVKNPPPRPKPVGQRGSQVRVERFELIGQPIRYDQAALNLKVTGRGLRFDLARDKNGKALLVLTDADEGTVEAKISKQDIQAVLAEVAAAAAQQQGITIQNLTLDLRSDGPRSVAAAVRVKARKMLMSGTIHVTGKLDVDDELNATLSDLAATGEGMVGNIAAGIVQRKLAPFDGATFPLMAFSLGDVALRGLMISVKDTLGVSAVFGRG